MHMGQVLVEAEEYIRRVRLCLFEVGFRDIRINEHGYMENGLPQLSTPNGAIPGPLAYMAARLAVIRDHPDVHQACWGCWRLSFDTQADTASSECRQGNCVTGGPAWPSHEELLGADRTEGLEIHANVA